MKNKCVCCITLLIIANLALSVQPLFCQGRDAANLAVNKSPLTLANIFNALTGGSSKFTISQRNKIAVKKVLELGIDFSLTPDIEKELRKARAGEELIAAIRLKSKLIFASSINSSTNESSYWESIKESQNEKDFEDYLKKYPNGHFAISAGNRLQSLAEAKNMDASPLEEMSPIINTDDLGIAGTWTGTRGLDSSNAFLIISGSRGNKFTAILKLRGFHVAVQGQINQKTRQMSMQEVKVIEIGNELSWTLSAFTGAISSDKKEMSGVMREKATNESKANIVWSFLKVD